MASITQHPHHTTLTHRESSANIQEIHEEVYVLTDCFIEAHISRFLRQYKVTPQTTTGISVISPAEMLMGVRPRLCLDLLIPNISSKTQHRQLSQKLHHDKRSKHRPIQVGDTVLVM